MQPKYTETRETKARLETQATLQVEAPEIVHQKCKESWETKNQTHIEDGQLTWTYCLSDDVLEGQTIVRGGKPKDI
jgi:hypothetical protein